MAILEHEPDEHDLDDHHDDGRQPEDEIEDLIDRLAVLGVVGIEPIVIPGKCRQRARCVRGAGAKQSHKNSGQPGKQSAKSLRASHCHAWQLDFTNPKRKHESTRIATNLHEFRIICAESTETQRAERNHFKFFLCVLCVSVNSAQSNSIQFIREDSCQFVSIRGFPDSIRKTTSLR